MTTWVAYLGSKLPVGSHNAYHREIVDEIVKATPEVLHIETLFASYQEAVELEQALIKQVAGSAYTTTVTDANERCDLWLRVFFEAQKAFMIAPAGSETLKHAEALKPIVGTYDGIHRHEQSRQVTETNGLLTAVATGEEVVAAVEALGLKPVFDQLRIENDRLEAAIRARNLEDADLLKAHGGLTASDQRKVVDNLYQQVVAHVNAYAIVEPSEAIENFIIEATATADYYANIAARDNGAKKPDLDPDPGTTDPEDPGTTEPTDPTEPGGEGGSPGGV